MKLVTYTQGGVATPGALLDSGDLLDLHQSLGTVLTRTPTSIADLLGMGADALRRAADVAAATAADPGTARERGWLAASDDVTLLGPTGHNPMLWTVGPLYPEHQREMGVADVTPAGMSIALRNANSIIGSGEAIRLPRAAPDMVDWEGEFALVVGKHAYEVDAAHAMAYIAGYTIYNDVSARDHVVPFIEEMNQPRGASAKYATLNLLYKEFPTFSPLGPCIVTKDAVDLDTLVLKTVVNGEVMQDFKVADTSFTIAEAVAYASTAFLLKPGDVISLGTSAGAGFAMTPARYLRAGDEVEISVDGVGVLRNPVVA